MSDILSLLQPGSYGFRGLDAGGPWSIAFAAAVGLKCHALHSGGCWLKLAGAPASVRIEAGDLVLLAGGDAFCLYTASDVLPIDSNRVFHATRPGETAILGGGGEVSGVGGFFKFESAQANAMLGLLPPFIHIRAGATDAELLWPIARLMRELRSPQPGGALVARHLAQTLLIEGLRLHLADGRMQGTGWLYALRDSRIRCAMAAMHADPARRWTLEDLAQTAGMSRTSFATRFKAILGEPAMAYLRRWRMLLAVRQLCDLRQPIAVVAPAVGYDSESAFGAAFKKVIGQSPKSFANTAS